MSKKTLNINALTNELHGASAFFKRPAVVSIPQPRPTEAVQAEEKNTLEITRTRAHPRQSSRENLRNLPTRDEIQEFSFRLRDEYKVKVQAEVPPHWQEELEEVARKLKVKKLELYRFILGEFLGKVKRQKPS